MRIKIRTSNVNVDLFMADEMAMQLILSVYQDSRCSRVSRFGINSMLEGKPRKRPPQAQAAAVVSLFMVFSLHYILMDMNLEETMLLSMFG